MLGALFARLDYLSGRQCDHSLDVGHLTPDIIARERKRSSPDEINCGAINKDKDAWEALAEVPIKELEHAGTAQGISSLSMWQVVPTGPWSIGAREAFEGLIFAR